MAQSKKKKLKTQRRQAYGILMLGVAVLILLAIVSFDVNDPVQLNIQDNPIRVSNWLGPLGASISYSLMQWTLGYPVVVFPLLLALFAIFAIRRKPFSELSRVVYLSLLWAVVISVYLALPDAFETQGQISEYYPSGLIGGWIASNLVIYLGKIGSLISMIAVTLALLVLSVRLEIDRFFRFIEFMVKQVAHGAAALKKGLTKSFAVLAERFEKRRRRKAQQARKKFSGQEEEQIPEISIEEQAETAAEDAEPEAEENEIKQEPQPIQTTLDDILARIDAANQATEAETGGDEKESKGQEDVDFEVKEQKQEKELDYDELVRESLSRYNFPSIDLLREPPETDTRVSREELRSNAELLEMKLNDFGVDARVIRVTAGPVITLYELQPAAGVKVNSIVSLANDLALALEARGIRMIAPIPGKAAVGIEIPNRNPQTVYLKSLIRSEQFNKNDYQLPLPIGKTINGESYIADLTRMPHLLIAGATGAGKSVGINTIIASLIYAVDPGKVKFLMIDPKKLELSLFRHLVDHYLIYRPDLDETVITKATNAVSILNSLVLEMEKRYEMLSTVNSRSIAEYNRKIKNGHARAEQEKLQTLPYIVVIIDELADLMMIAAKEVETPIARLAQMARAVGIHMIVATQRPSVDVITGMIKANFPARLAYQVATKVDSRTVLDMNGAEQLLGNGDMLFLPPGSAKPIRLQNPFVSTDEVEQIIEHISRQPKMPYYSLPQPASSGSDAGGFGGAGGERDPLYKDAMAIVVQHQQGSISLLQRRLKIGYARAARIMDELEEEGVVGPPDGSKAREVLMTLQELQEMQS